MNRFTYASVFILGLFSLRSSTQNSIQIFANKDNTIISDFMSNSNGEGPFVYVGLSGNGGIRRGLLSFQVFTLPTSIVVDSVSLTMNCTKIPNISSDTFYLHQLTQHFGEGSSSTQQGGGAQAENGDATWQDAYYDSIDWNTAGGDYDTTQLSTCLIDDFGSFTFQNTSIFTQVVQNWLNSATDGLNLLLKTNEQNTHTLKGFASKESTDTASFLTIYYHTTSTNILQNNSPKDFLIFPNPARSNQAIQIQADQKITSVNVYNNHMQLINNYIYNTSNIVLEHLLRPGSYLFEIALKNGAKIQKNILIQ